MHLKVYRYETVDGKVSYLLAADHHEAASLAAQHSGGSDKVKDVSISYEQ